MGDSSVDSDLDCERQTIKKEWYESMIYELIYESMEIESMDSMEMANDLSISTATACTKRTADQDDLECDGPDEVDSGSGLMHAGMINTLRKLFRKQKKAPLEAFANDDIYMPKESNSKYGCGVCIIATLFTGDLKGYKMDHLYLRELFVKMEYTVFEAQNCTKAELIHFLKKTCQSIESGEKAFDRLVCVVSSHGLKEGLLTCDSEDPSGQCEESDPTNKSKPLITPFDEVISFLKHDKLTKLKNHPKLVLFQCCKGKGVVKAAGATRKTAARYSTAIKIEDDFQHKVVPVDADFAICYASTENHMSFVETNGSWFTRALIETFRDHSGSNHVTDMLTTVHRKVAEKRKSYKYQLEDESTGVCEERRTIAVQIPCTFSTLRKQFWLEHNVFGSKK